MRKSFHLSSCLPLCLSVAHTGSELRDERRHFTIAASVQSLEYAGFAEVSKRALVAQGLRHSHRGDVIGGLVKKDVKMWRMIF